MKHALIGKVTARAAAVRYRHPARDLRIIAVAGAYGKRTTALLVGELLQEAHLSVVTMTTDGCRFNDQPLELHYDASAQGLQHALAKAKQKKARFVVIELTKRLLETHALSTLPIEMAIVTSDDPTARDILSQPTNYAVVPSGFDVDNLSVAPHQAISFGTDDLAEAKIAHAQLRRGGTEIDLVIDHQTKLELATYLRGKANIMNVAAAVAGAYVLSADIGTLQEGVARLERVRGNFEKVTTDKPYTLFLDRAVASTSVQLAVESAREFTKRRLLVALDSSVEKESYTLAKSLADRLVVVGEDEPEPGVEIAPTAREAVELVTRAAKKNDVVLLLGKEFSQQDSTGLRMPEQVMSGDHE